MYVCTLMCKHACLCAHARECSPRKVLVGMTVARDAPTGVPLCLCAMIMYLCAMPVWGRGRGRMGFMFTKLPVCL